MNDVRFIDIVRTTKKQTKENHTLGGKEMIYGNKDRQTILIEEGESTNKVFHLMMEIPLINAWKITPPHLDTHLE